MTYRRQNSKIVQGIYFYIFNKIKIKVLISLIVTRNE